MVTNRQKELLKKIVEEYIRTVKPVGSKSLCEELDCSSATIRNDMVDLEDLGFLEKTHISSGRIPSEKGYRYYVDELMEPKKMTGEEVLKLQTIFKNNKLVLSDAITKSMEIISDMTSYTSIVLGKASSDNKLKKIEVIPLNELELIAIIVTDKGHVENKQIKIGETISMDDVKKTVDLINTLVVGTPIDEVSEKLEFEVKPIIGNYIKQHEAVYSMFYDAFSEFSQKSSSYNVSVRTNMLSQPEFDDTDIIVFGFVIICLLAASPTIFSPFLNATTDGVVLPPSGVGIIFGSPASSTLTQLFVVPKSIPVSYTHLRRRRWEG